MTIRWIYSEGNNVKENDIEINNTEQERNRKLGLIVSARTERVQFAWAQRVANTRKL